ncbi:ABC transporter permease [Hyperthermus butylicus]|uniref:ABC-type uncharacterized transport, permease n=1 Tax=Hyperthermus butylicus (strain DSM 5456 / JCM 9403 / PLM1-5) TaxID=415426 RepID=A2BJ11_HYPBU|nr:ABC transporter permease [Hyperthermus butylicus]ABM79972.1 ABC-type uncharacterized transport, permease [Hyperthermus butylicus DSM 5456]
MRLELVEKAPWERGNPLLYGLAGLAAGMLVSIAVGALTPRGVGGVAAAFYKAFTNPNSYFDSLPYFVPIGLSAAGLALAYRAGFITIGSEGQVILGLTVTHGLLAYVLWDAPGLAGLVAALVLAAIVGGACGLLVGAMRAYLGTNETLISLMLNYVVVAIVNYLVSGPWKAGRFTMTVVLPEKFWVSGATAAAVAAAAIVVLDLVHRFTRLGVAIDAVGAARKAAETYGVDPRRTILAAAALSGAAAGLGGALYIVSIHTPLTTIGKGGLGYGYMGVLAAWLAGLRPLGALAAGMLLAVLYNMVSMLQLQGIPASLVYAFEAILVLSVLIATTLSRYKLVVRRND